MATARRLDAEFCRIGGAHWQAGKLVTLRLALRRFSSLANRMLSRWTVTAVILEPD